MVIKSACNWIASLALLLVLTAAAAAQEAGAIRGSIHDKEFDVPLPGVQVSIAETGAKTISTGEGNFVFSQVAPGAYTLVFAKDGYLRQVKADVRVATGQMADLDIALLGEFTEMEEMVVKDIQLGGASESGQLALRATSPALIDSVSAEYMKMAGVSDAAQAVKLVTGVSVQDNKYAVVRGLPDRYVTTQMNGVRLPTADMDKRAVQLDQFPAALIDSIRVTKTFTPDQQGDASGGAVNIILKGIPDHNIAKIEGLGVGNTQVTGRSDFLSYKDSNLHYLGYNRQDIPPSGEFFSPVGVSKEHTPPAYNYELELGGKHDFDTGLKVGGLTDYYYKREASMWKGKDDSQWVESPGEKMTPQYLQGTPGTGQFNTALFDIIKSTEQIRWGWLNAVGAEMNGQSITLLDMYTHAAANTVTEADDTRGKSYYFPGYNPTDPKDPGNSFGSRFMAPYLRSETLDYAERTTETLQLQGRNKVPMEDVCITKYFYILPPELDWTIAKSSAEYYDPDHRQFGSSWLGPSYSPGFPPWVPPSTSPAMWIPWKPAQNFTLGNVQEVWKDVLERSNEWSINGKFPFKQWSGDTGYLKLGVFDDELRRNYNQASFSNFGDAAAYAGFPGSDQDYWSKYFIQEGHPISGGGIDDPYFGKQIITACYYMVDFPLCQYVRVIGGMRHEETQLYMTNHPEPFSTWLPPDSTSLVKLNPGDADVKYLKNDNLPAIALVVTPVKPVKMEFAYSETIARQTFKELSPIFQTEYLGGPIFIGNPQLEESHLKNYDFRTDYTPAEGTLLSGSWFKKDVTKPIEYTQGGTSDGFDYTTATNYPAGTLRGFEVEARQKLGPLAKFLDGFAVGTNATFIRSKVILPEDENKALIYNDHAPMSSRDMTNCPEYLFNFYTTYQNVKTGTDLGVFYNIRGDTLEAGAGDNNGHYVPNLYARSYATLNFTATQKIWGPLKLKFQAKNLTDPQIQEVYRSRYIGPDVIKTSHRNGIELVIGLCAEFTF